LINTDDIDKYIDKIPPMADSVRNCLKFLKEEDLQGAAKSIESDTAFKQYVLNIVNKPIYGFANEIKDVNQVFSILGVIKMKQLLISYLVSILAPSNWKVFYMTNSLFQDFQAEILANWNNILIEKYKVKEDEDFMMSATILCSTIIVLEELFKDHIETVDLLQRRNDLDYNTILFRLTKMSIFEIAIRIAQKWEVSQKSQNIILASSGNDKYKDLDSLTLENGKFLHLLLFMELSKPKFINANLNGFVEFKIDFIQDIQEEFISMFHMGED
jgi:HD-like signal output (HDOD) protein